MTMANGAKMNNSAEAKKINRSWRGHTPGATRRRHRRPGRPRQSAALRRLLSSATVMELVHSAPRIVQLTTSHDDLATVFANDDTPAIVVVDHDNSFQGIVTRAAVRDAAFAERRFHARCGAESPLADPEPPLTSQDDPVPVVTAADLLSPTVEIAGSEAPVSHALAMVASSDAKALLVVGRADELVGVIGRGDVLRWLAASSGYLRRR